jgi:hypothetical protein
VRKRFEVQWSDEVEWDVAPASELLKRSGEPSAIVTIGAQAWREVARHFAERRRGPPLIATLLPAAAFRAESEALSRLRASAVWLDQPPSRQSRLLRELLPRARQISVLFGAESRGDAHRLADALQQAGFRASLFEADDDSLPQQMTAAFSDADALVALPDPGIFTVRSVPQLLAASYRRLVPVIGYGPGLVKGGALAALHTPPEQLAPSVAALLVDVLQGRPLRAPGPADSFDLSVNSAVARSLELPVNAAVILNRLRAAERRGDVAP